MMKKKIFIYGLVLVIIILSLYLSFYNGWGISGDDYATLGSSKVLSFDDFINLFEFKPYNQIGFPDNVKTDSFNFLNVSYRPLSRLFFAVQVYFFGDNPDYYYLIYVFIHSLNVLLVFILLFFLFGNLFIAFLTSLFWGIHGSLGFWIGWIATQNYVFCLFFTLLSVFSFFKFLQNTLYKKWLFYSSFFFMIALFLFEGVVFLPFSIVSFAFIYDFFKKRFLKFPKNVFDYLKYTFSYWVCLFIYFLIRFVGFGFAHSKNVLLSSAFVSVFYKNLREIFREFLNLYTLEKYFGVYFTNLIILFVIFFFILIIINSLYKKETLLFAANFFMGSWVNLYLTHSGRYSYVSSVFFIIIFYFFIIFIQNMKFNNKKRILILIGLVFLFIYNLWWTVGNMVCRKNWQQKGYYVYQSILKESIDTNSSSICFLGLPSLFGTDIKGFFRLHEINLNYNIYYDTATFITKFSNKTVLNIFPKKSGYLLRIVSNDGACFFYSLSGISMGKVDYLDHKSDQNKYLMRYVFDEEYLNKKMTFVTWDYQKSEFKILTEKPL